MRQFLETQIVYAPYYDNCPETRVSRLKALLERVPNKELDFSPTKEVFIRSNENRIKIDNLSKEKAITYACEVGEKLTSFDLSLYSGKVTLEDLTRLVQACPNILQLDLDSLKLDGFPSSKKVTDAILKHTKLESLRITGYGLDQEFFEKLVDIKNLKKLDISFCYFGNSSIQKLTKLEHIESLTLQGNIARYGGYSPALTDEVLDLLKMFPKLRTVNLKGQKISLEAVKKFKNENPQVEVILDFPTKPVS